MSEWLRLATSPRVVRRAIKYAIGVGALLIAINHGQALLNGEVSRGRVYSMILTCLVPYCVSTASSVNAMRERAAKEETPIH
jgi:hypothetical protein